MADPQLEDKDEVYKLMREILDKKYFKGQPIKNLNRKRLIRVMAILIQYTKFAEERVEQLHALITKMLKEKEENEPAEQTKIIT